MTSFIRVVFLLIFLSVSTGTARRLPPNVPWRNREDCKNFLSVFLNDISDVLDQQGQTDLELLFGDLLSLISHLHGELTVSKLQAANMLFASIISDIVATEGKGSTQQKIARVRKALIQAFEDTTRYINTALINEILSMVEVFNQKENEIDTDFSEQESSSQVGSTGEYETFGAVTSSQQSTSASAAAAQSSLTVSTTQTSSAAGSASLASATSASEASTASSTSSASEAYTASSTSSASEASSAFTQCVTSILTLNPEFTSQFDSIASSGAASAYASASAETVAYSVGQDGLASIIASGVSQATSGIMGCYPFVQAYAFALAQILSAHGVLNLDNAITLASNFGNSLLTTISSAVTSSQQSTSVSAAAATAQSSSTVSTMTSTSQTSSSAGSTSLASASSASEASTASSTSSASEAYTASSTSSASEASSAFTQCVTSILTLNPEFTSQFDSIASSGAASAYASTSAETVAYSVGHGGLAPIIASAVSQATTGIEGCYPFVQAYAFALAQILSAHGVLNSDNAITLASIFGNSLLTTISSASANSEASASATAGSSSLQTSSAAANAFASSGASDASYGESLESPFFPGFGGQNNFDFLVPSSGNYGVSGSPELAPYSSLVSEVLQSPSGLTSPAASQRIASEMPLLVQAVSGNFNAPLFSAILSSMVSQISQGTSLSQDEVVIEALMELISALLHILPSAQLGAVSTDSQATEIYAAVQSAFNSINA